MAGPIMEMKLKHKATGKRSRVFALWQATRGNGGEPIKGVYTATPEKAFKDRPGVVGLLMSDGSKLSLADYYIDVAVPYDDRNAASAKDKRQEEDDNEGGFGF